MSEELKISLRESGKIVDAEAILAATLDPRDGTIQRLQARFTGLEVKDNQLLQDFSTHYDPRDTQDFCIELTQRIRRYLIHEEGKGKKKISHPTRYAELLTQALKNPTTLSAVQKKGLAELSTTVVAELTPILKSLQKYLHNKVAPQLSEMSGIQDIATPDGLLAFLRVGSVGDQETYSFFGALDFLASRIKDFPTIDLGETALEAQLPVQDPFSDATRAYWREKVRIHRDIYGKKITTPEIVAVRSSLARDELIQQKKIVQKSISELQFLVKSTDDDTKKKEIEQRIEEAERSLSACDFLASWLDQETKALDEISSESFNTHISDLTFAWGNEYEIEAALNSLEALKRYDKEIYARLLGITSQTTSPEAKRSDLFGNALHIAVAHSLHAPVTPVIVGSDAFHTRMVNLTNLDVSQAPLVYVGQEDWMRAEGKSLPGPEQGEKTKVDLAMREAFLLVSNPESYAIWKMVEANNAERRSELLVKLSNARPDEFFALIKALPHNAKWYEDHDVPEDIASVIDVRCIQVKPDRKANGFATYYEPLDITPKLFVASIKINALKKLTTSRYDPPVSPENLIKTELWRTTPSECVLEGEEFSRFLETQTSGLQKLDQELEKLKKKLDENVATREAAKKRIEEMKTKGIDQESVVIPEAFNAIATYEGDTVFKQSEKKIGIIEKNLEKDQKKRMGIVESILAILDAHPDITQEQWIEWWIRISGDEKNTIIYSKRQAKQVKEYNKKVERMCELFRAIKPSDVLNSVSRFFVLIPEVMVRNVDWDSPEDYKDEKNLGNEAKVLALFFPLIEKDEKIGREILDNPMNKYLLYFKIFKAETFSRRCSKDMLGDLGDVLDEFILLFSDQDRMAIVEELIKSANILLTKVQARKGLGSGCFNNVKEIEWICALLNVCQEFSPSNESFSSFLYSLEYGPYSAPLTYHALADTGDYDYRFKKVDGVWVIMRIEHNHHVRGDKPWEEIP